MALGSGLSGLLEDANFDYDRELNAGRVASIKISQITPNPFQPRSHFDKDALKELASSIKAHGLLQPITVIKKSKNEYILVSGERRMRATKLLGNDEINAIIASVNEQKLRELALIENIQREDLNALEIAKSLNELICEHKITQEEVALMVKKSRSWVANTLRILKLDKDVQEKIADGQISSGHAKILAGLDKDNERILASSIIGQKLNVRQTEELAKKIKKPSENKNNLELNSKLENLKKYFSKLGISANASKNKITLSFENSKEVEKLLLKLSKI